jgi:CubicO group peptidase (beta-lactamase class C family)
MNTNRRSNSFVLNTLLTPLLVFSIPAIAQNVYFPPAGEWEERQADQVGFSQNELNGLIKFAIENEYQGASDLRIAIAEGFEREPYHRIAGPVRARGGPAGVVIKDGYLVAKWGDVDRVDMTFSVTKSYLSTVAGLAWDDDLIDNIHEPVAALVWDGTFDGEHNSTVSWDHLLTQSSDWYGELFGMRDWADRPPEEGSIDDWRNRQLHTPGTHYKYNDVRVNLLSYALLQVWRKPLPAVLRDRIMNPIGASPTWRWYGYDSSWVEVDGMRIQSVSGGGHSGGGMFINTLDHARFGYLFLRDGNWNGKQLISSDWVKMVQQPSAAYEAYGYLWWLNRGDQHVEGVPESVYLAAGFGGNFIIVDQEHDLVIVTRWLNPEKRSEFLKMAIDALE